MDVGYVSENRYRRRKRTLRRRRSLQRRTIGRRVPIEQRRRIYQHPVASTFHIKQRGRVQPLEPSQVEAVKQGQTNYAISQVSAMRRIHYERQAAYVKNKRSWVDVSRDLSKVAWPFKAVLTHEYTRIGAQMTLRVVGGAFMTVFLTPYMSPVLAQTSSQVIIYVLETAPRLIWTRTDGKWTWKQEGIKFAGYAVSASITTGLASGLKTESFIGNIAASVTGNMVGTTANISLQGYCNVGIGKQFNDELRSEYVRYQELPHLDRATRFTRFMKSWTTDVFTQAMIPSLCVGFLVGIDAYLGTQFTTLAAALAPEKVEELQSMVITSLIMNALPISQIMQEVQRQYAQIRGMDKAGPRFRSKVKRDLTNGQKAEVVMLKLTNIVGTAVANAAAKTYIIGENKNADPKTVTPEQIKNIAMNATLDDIATASSQVRSGFPDLQGQEFINRLTQRLVQNYLDKHGTGDVSSYNEPLKTSNKDRKFWIPLNSGKGQMSPNPDYIDPSGGSKEPMTPEQLQNFIQNEFYKSPDFIPHPEVDAGTQEKDPNIHSSTAATEKPSDAIPDLPAEDADPEFIDSEKAKQLFLDGLDEAALRIEKKYGNSSRPVVSHLRRLKGVLKGELPTTDLPVDWQDLQHELSSQIRFSQKSLENYLSQLDKAVKNIDERIKQNIAQQAEIERKATETAKKQAERDAIAERRKARLEERAQKRELRLQEQAKRDKLEDKLKAKEEARKERLRKQRERDEREERDRRIAREEFDKALEDAKNKTPIRTPEELLKDVNERYLEDRKYKSKSHVPSTSEILRDHTKQDAAERAATELELLQHAEKRALEKLRRKLLKSRRELKAVKEKSLPKSFVDFDRKKPVVKQPQSKPKSVGDRIFGDLSAEDYKSWVFEGQRAQIATTIADALSESFKDSIKNAEELETLRTHIRDLLLDNNKMFNLMTGFVQPTKQAQEDAKTNQENNNDNEGREYGPQNLSWEPNMNYMTDGLMYTFFDPNKWAASQMNFLKDWQPQDIVNQFALSAFENHFKGFGVGIKAVSRVGQTASLINAGFSAVNAQSITQDGMDSWIQTGSNPNNSLQSSIDMYKSFEALYDIGDKAANIRETVNQLVTEKVQEATYNRQFNIPLAMLSYMIEPTNPIFQYMGKSRAEVLASIAVGEGPAQAVRVGETATSVVRSLLNLDQVEVRERELNQLFDSVQDKQETKDYLQSVINFRTSILQGQDYTTARTEYGLAQRAFRNMIGDQSSTFNLMQRLNKLARKQDPEDTRSWWNRAQTNGFLRGL
jgi:hypothetical protein